MKHLALLVFLTLLVSHIPPTLAGSLKKYGTESLPAQQAPSPQSEYSAQIEQEMRIYNVLKNMPENERNQWLDNYQERFEQALSKNEMSKAKFYLNIIRRWR